MDPMLNPFGNQEDAEKKLFSRLMDFGSLEKRLFRRLRSAKVDDQIFQAVQNAFEGALKQENVILSRPERMALLYRMLKRVLADMLKKLDRPSA